MVLESMHLGNMPLIVDKCDTQHKAFGAVSADKLHISAAQMLFMLRCANALIQLNNHGILESWYVSADMTTD